MEWRKEEVVALIEMYRDRRILWDPNHPDHRSRPRKHTAWQEIAAVLHVPRAEAESKMRKLTGQFYREEKRCSSGEVDSKWFAYRLLLFLRDKRQQQLHAADNDTLQDTSLDHYREAEESASEAYEYEVHPDHEPLMSRETSITSEIEAESSSRGIRPKRKAEPLFTTNDSSKKMRQSRVSLGPGEEHLSAWRNYRDEYDVFGEHVAVTIRKLNNLYAKAIAKHEINNILFKAEMGMFDSPQLHSSGRYHARDTASEITATATTSGQTNESNFLTADFKEDSSHA